MTPPFWLEYPSEWWIRKSTAPSFAGWQRFAGSSIGRAESKRWTHGERRLRLGGADDPAGGDPERARALRPGICAGGRRARGGRDRRRVLRRHRLRRGPALGHGERAP